MGERLHSEVRLAAAGALAVMGLHGNAREHTSLSRGEALGSHSPPPPPPTPPPPPPPPPTHHPPSRSLSPEFLCTS